MALMSISANENKPMGEMPGHMLSWRPSVSSAHCPLGGYTGPLSDKSCVYFFLDGTCLNLSHGGLSG